MTFNRYSEQCVNCACYIENVGDDVKDLLDEVGIECSLEQPMFDESVCNYFQEE